MGNGQNGKTCFVICPIGEDGTLVRRRSDKILRHILSPVLEAAGYTVERADNIDEPGLITRQIIQRILEAPLVIADLTGHNANVFYELALRHVLRKPVIHLIERGQPIPFDINMQRVIFVDHCDLDSVAECKDKLSAQIKLFEENRDTIESPISQVVDWMQHLQNTQEPLEQQIYRLINKVEDMLLSISALKKQVTYQNSHLSNGPVAAHSYIEPELLQQLLLRLAVALPPVSTP
jgi:hypothetical protein